MKTFAKFALSLCLTVLVSLSWGTHSLVASAAPLSVGATLAVVSKQPVKKPCNFIGRNSKATKKEVQLIQNKVNKTEIIQPIAEDGIFGEDTEAVVMAFQKSKGLEADGCVGPKTAKALGIDLSLLPTVAKALTPPKA